MSDRHAHTKLLIESNSFSNNGNDIETDIEYLGYEYLASKYTIQNIRKFLKKRKKNQK